MKSKVIKITCLISILFILCSFLDCSLSFDATELKGINDISQVGDAGNIGTALNKTIGIIQLVGNGLSLIFIMILGIKYMLASPSERADTKKQILPIVIGIVLIFAAVNIVGIIADVNEKFNG